MPVDAAAREAIKIIPHRVIVFSQNIGLKIIILVSIHTSC